MIEITYQRKAKEYQWTDPTSGEILTAPSGQKHELFKTVVGMLEPDLYTAAINWIDRTPQLERIIWKAVQLVIENKVEMFTPPKGDIIAMVDGSDQYGRYCIQHTTEQNICGCVSFREFPNYDERGFIWCKHLAAVRLANVARSEF